MTKSGALAARLSLIHISLGGVGFGIWLLWQNPASAALSIGAGLCCAGLTILSFFAMWQLSSCLVHLTAALIRWGKRRMIKKEAA